MGRRERRKQPVWCELLSCIGKMTLAEAQGFLLLKPSDLQPPPVSLPSPSCVFRPAMKHSDGVIALSLTFPLAHTLYVNSVGAPPPNTKSENTRCLFFERGIIDRGKVHLTKVEQRSFKSKREGKKGQSVLTIGDNRTQHSVELVSVRGNAVI